MGPHKVIAFGREKNDTNGPRDVEKEPSHKQELTGAPEVAQSTKKIDTNGPRDVKNGPSHNKKLTEAYKKLYTRNYLHLYNLSSHIHQKLQ